MASLVSVMGSDQKPGRRSRRKAASDCRRGTHRYGSPKVIGGGMTRQTCSVCGAVTIDLTHADRGAEATLSSRASPRKSRH